MNSIVKRNLFSNPKFLYTLAILLFICALVANPWCHSYKNWILQYEYLQSKGTSLKSFLSIIEIFGKGASIAFLAFIIGACGFKKLAYRIGVSLIIMAIIVGVLKPIVGRERPNGKNDHSFPSGDSVTAAAFFVPIAAESVVLTPIAVVIIPAVAFLRTYDNWHWISDVLTGIGVGLLTSAIALQLCKKKNKLYHRLYFKIKYRYLALVALIIFLACFIPGAIKQGGGFLDFTQFYGPAVFMWLMASYVPFLFKERSDKNRKIWKPVSSLKKFTQSKFTNSMPHKPVIGIIIIISIIIIIFFTITPWLLPLQNLRLASSGIGIGLLALLLLLKKEKRLNNIRKMKAVFFYGIIILLLSILIILTPAYFSYKEYYTELSPGAWNYQKELIL